MPTSDPGNSVGRVQRPARRRARGFTLIEIVVVLAIIAIGSALVALSIRDPASTRLEHEAARLVALLESARTEARAGGFDVVWAPGTDPAQPEAFRFVGLPAGIEMPTRWLDSAVSAQVVGATSLQLGPDAILPPQRVVLRLEDQRLEVGSDGIGAFAVVEPLATGS